MIPNKKYTSYQNIKQKAKMRLKASTVVYPPSFRSSYIESAGGV